jgi:hypothetical protein
VTPESQSNLRLEIGHVLFIDLVGYSKLLIEEQKERLRQLTEIVLATAQMHEAPDEQVVRLPTGDGMALVFHNSSEEPAQCALEIAQALKTHPEIAVRMDIHSGPVDGAPLLLKIPERLESSPPFFAFLEANLVSRRYPIQKKLASSSPTHGLCLLCCCKCS